VGASFEIRFLSRMIDYFENLCNFIKSHFFLTSSETLCKFAISKASQSSDRGQGRRSINFIPGNTRSSLAGFPDNPRPQSKPTSPVATGTVWLNTEVCNPYNYATESLIPSDVFPSPIIHSSKKGCSFHFTLKI